MKRTPLKRTTELKRGGKLRPKAKNPGKHRDLDMQAHYRRERDYCEVSNWLSRYWPEMYFRDDVLDLHHIVPGSGRKDYWTNMIRINRTFHRWLTDHDDFNGNIVCLGVKLLNNELELDKLRECRGARLEWWLTRRTPHPAVMQLYDELMAVAVTESDERTN